MTQRIWIHGAGLTPAFWSDRASGLRLSLPGHGTDTPLPGSVGDIATVLLQDCPDTFDVVGHSLGGMVALAMADIAPQAVRRMVLVETLAVMPPLPDDAGSDLPPWLRIAPGVDRSTVAAALMLSAGFDGRDMAKRASMPVCVMHGQDNPFTADGARVLADLLPDARLQALPGGHYLPADIPGPFHDAVDAFLGDPK